MTAVRPTETQRQRRGHDFWPSAAELLKIPGLYDQEDRPIADKVLWLHYFCGGTGCDWWVAEVDAELTTAYGYGCLGDIEMAEWGYVNLVEIEASAVRLALSGTRIDSLALQQPVERDLHWVPKKAADADLPGAGS